jgi:sporulation protein YlmC with PRC-barrel domain
MLKKLLVTTALSGLLATSALAQSTPPSGDVMKSDAPKSSSSMSSSTIASQSADQLMASKLKGANVYGSDDQKIGDVSDLMFSKDGKLEAYILSVGGFLGVGAKEVALQPTQIQLSQDKGDWKLTVSMTKDQLAQAPNFERHKEPTTTGSATGGPGAMPRNTPPTGGTSPATPAR